jgi:patatin-like phospholipase/acyl hydrolase
MFKILALDGGGSRSAFEAGFLAEIERTIGEPIAGYFDMIAGTATGGIIGVLLALGIPATEIKEVYSKRLAKLFEPYESTFTGMHRILTELSSPLVERLTSVTAAHFLYPKYTGTGLESLAKEFVKDLKLTDITSCRLLIPTVNLIHGKPFIFKTRHLPDQGDNYDFLLMDVLRATIASPTFFTPLRLEGHGVFSDGGIWANNPALVAYAEATNIAAHCRRPSDPVFTTDDIYILSVGCGHAMENYTPPANRAGMKFWATRLLELMFESQGRSTNFYLERLMQERFKRINFERTHLQSGPGADIHHIEDIMQMGKFAAQREYDSVREVFLVEKASPPQPF